MFPYSLSDRRSWVVLACVSIAVAPCDAATVYVDAAARPGGAGATWATAYRFLQDALVAASQGNVTEIRIAQGTYLPDRSESVLAEPGNRFATFDLPSGVAVRGGYAGVAGADPDERDIERFITVLSGDLGQDDGPAFRGYEENSFHVVSGAFLANTTLLEGVTISGGNADGGTGTTLDWGAGVNLFSSDLVMRQCALLDCRVNAQGAALFSNVGSPVLDSCQIAGNFCSGGSAVAISTGSPQLLSCTFVNNLAGGAVLNSTFNATVISNCTFLGNDGPSGSGLNLNNSSNTVVQDCVFADNVATALRITTLGVVQVRDCSFQYNVGYDGGAGWIEGQARFERCEFTGNEATNRGGAVINFNGDLTYIDCTFDSNFGSFGGAIYNFSQSELLEDLSVTVDSCLFTDNTGGWGGAIYDERAGSWVTNSRFERNLAGLGGAISNYKSDMVIRFCDFIENAANGHGGAIFNGAGSYPFIFASRFIRCSANERAGAISSFQCDHRIASCLFIANSAPTSAAVHSEMGGLYECSNCTFVGHFAPAGPSVIGHVGSSGSWELTNSILWGNRVPVLSSGGVVSVSYSDVQTPVAGIGNISLDPLFVDAVGVDSVLWSGDENLRLAGASPCIDAGSNFAVPEATLQDLDGLPRFVDDPAAADTGLGLAPLVDMGAYEKGLNPADFNGDGHVDGIDLALLLGAWGACPVRGDCLADLDGDGMVNGMDLALLLGTWG